MLLIIHGKGILDPEWIQLVRLDQSDLELFHYPLQDMITLIRSRKLPGNREMPIYRYEDLLSPGFKTRSMKRYLDKMGKRNYGIVLKLEDAFQNAMGTGILDRHAFVHHPLVAARMGGTMTPEYIGQYFDKVVEAFPGSRNPALKCFSALGSDTVMDMHRLPLGGFLDLTPDEGVVNSGNNSAVMLTL